MICFPSVGDVAAEADLPTLAGLKLLQDRIRHEKDDEALGLPDAWKVCRAFGCTAQRFESRSGQCLAEYGSMQGSESDVAFPETPPELFASQPTDGNLHAAVLGPALRGVVAGHGVDFSVPHINHVPGIQFKVLD